MATRKATAPAPARKMRVRKEKPETRLVVIIQDKLPKDNIDRICRQIEGTLGTSFEVKARPMRRRYRSADTGHLLQKSDAEAADQATVLVEWV